MLKLENIPLSVINRALDLYGADRQSTTPLAWDTLRSAEGRIDIAPITTSEGTRLTPIALAVAEYMSLSGPWAEDGEYEGDTGYEVDAA